MDLESVLALVAAAVMFGSAILMLVLSTGRWKQSGPPRPHWSIAGIPSATRERAESLIAEGKKIQAIKEIRNDTGLSLQHAKEVGDALQEGTLVPYVAADADLADRARALRSAGQPEAAVTLVADSTGMRRDEAERFVTALDAA